MLSKVIFYDPVNVENKFMKNSLLAMIFVLLMANLFFPTKSSKSKMSLFFTSIRYYVNAS